MKSTRTCQAKSSGIRACAYSGDNCVLLAFSLDPGKTGRLAGFAIRRRGTKGGWQWLNNRINFASNYTKDTTAEDRDWTPSNVAPFQKFWWVDFPPDIHGGDVEYEITAMRFTGKDTSRLEPGQTVTLKVPVGPFSKDALEVAFTRGYMCSQAYAAKFNNAPIAPDKRTISYNTAKYEKQYAWLGAHAREALNSFLDKCLKDKNTTIDVFAYDFDEPGIISAMEKFGPRLRLILDNAELHTETGALENTAFARLKKSAGAANTKRGKFGRFQHNKVIIRKVNGKPRSVLAGSTNFSVNGLYINANNIMVFDTPGVAGRYQAAFDEAFANNVSAGEFKKNEIACKEWPAPSGKPCGASFSFAPHAKPTFSLDRLGEALKNVESSVLFAVMEMGGGGNVLSTLRDLHSSGKVFSYGVTERLPKTGSSKGVKVFTGSNRGNGVLVPAGALNKLVPEPFRKEATGGSAHKIHHKFVVVDFNGKNPMVFAGSSNLAEGGEQANGDNLVTFCDPDVAACFAVEAIRLVDHYAFRAAIQKASDNKPLCLKTDSDNWWAPYYDADSIKSRERRLFAGEDT